MKDDRLDVSAPTLSSDIGAAGSTALDRWALRRIREAFRSARVDLILWDGFGLPSTAGPPFAAAIVKNRRALFSCLWNPELNFGESYMFGDVEIRGDLVAILEEVYRALATLGRRAGSWRHATNTVRAARKNVHHHYDIGNAFYRLWLDREMVYTCGYFPTPACTLEEAQAAKMDLVCRKVRLQPGERVVEAGCGWGALALYMAKQYGVTVRAFNISAEQIAYAREGAQAEGLTDRVEFVNDDYRSVQGKYDAFISVGMLEHVELPDYSTLGGVIDRVLTESGRGLLHFIGRNRPGPLNPWIRKRIFPGGYPPTLREVFEHVLEPAALSVLDVENLRLHYAKTLEHWLQRFNAAADTVASMFDEVFVRAWRLYLAGSQAAFRAGSTELFQVVFARERNNAIPWRRVDA